MRARMSKNSARGPSALGQAGADLVFDRFRQPVIDQRVERDRDRTELRIDPAQHVGLVSIQPDVGDPDQDHDRDEQQKAQEKCAQ